MAYGRRRYRNPAFGRGTGGASVQRVVDFSSASGTSWPPDRVLMPNDTIASLGALSSLLSIYGNADATELAQHLGKYLVIAQRITHNRSEPAALARHINTLCAMLAGISQDEASFDAMWTAIGRAGRSAIQSWPENLAAGFWRAVDSIVEQVTVAQMPGYMFGQPFAAPLPPNPSGVLPRGEPPNPHNNATGGTIRTVRSTGASSSPSSSSTSLVDSLTRAGINNADVIGPIVGSVLGSYFGPGGAALGATGGEAIGQLIKQRYGSNPTASQAAQAAEDYARGQSTPETQQQPLPGFGGARPQSTPNATGQQQPLIPAEYGGGNEGIGATAGGAVGGLVGGIYGQGEAGRTVGDLAGQGIQAGINAIIKNT